MTITHTPTDGFFVEATVTESLGGATWLLSRRYIGYSEEEAKEAFTAHVEFNEWELA